MTAKAEWAWAAGLFEGEGCITHRLQGNHTVRHLRLGMTDEDVVRRFHKVVGAGTVRVHLRENCQPLWCWFCGQWAETERILNHFLPWLGERRSQKANSLLADPAMHYNGRKTHCKRGHPFSGGNLILRKDGRQCRACGRFRSRQYMQRKRRKQRGVESNVPAEDLIREARAA